MNDDGIFARLQAGIWKDNPGLVQLLGLCPLLAVTTTLVNGIGLGLATLFVLTLSNALVSATRRWIRNEIRISNLCPDHRQPCNLHRTYL